MAERLKSADVIFEGVLRSIAYARREHKEGRLVVYGPPGLVLAGVDPRFMIEIEVRKVRKGDAKEWTGARSLAIHSLAESFAGDTTEAGKAFVFYLWARKTNAKEYVELTALPLP